MERVHKSYMYLVSAILFHKQSEKEKNVILLFTIFLHYPIYTLKETMMKKKTVLSIVSEKNPTKPLFFYVCEKKRRTDCVDLMKYDLTLCICSNSSIDSKSEYFRRLSFRRNLITTIGHIACKGDNTQFHFNLICCIQTCSRHSLTIRLCVMNALTFAKE